MQANPADGINVLKQLEHRIARLQRQAAQLEVVSNKYWTARRVIVAAGILLALSLCKYQGQTVALVLAAFFIALFWLVAFKHKAIKDSIVRHSLMVHIKQVQIARIRLDWDHLPTPELSLPDPAHPFAEDLDITGARSLHRLLDSAVTREGSRRLKSWLLNTRPDLATIRKRQALVQELKTYSLFRDKLQLNSMLASGNLDGRASQWDAGLLVEWLEHPESNQPLIGIVRVLGLLAALNLSLIVLNGFGVIPPVWPLVFLTYIGVMIAKQSRIGGAWGDVLDLETVLRRFTAVFQYLESGKHQSGPGLAEICAPFRNKRERPSAELRRVGRIAGALGLRTNVILWVLVNALFPWDFYFTHRLELLKKDLAHLFPVWLDAWFELEALNSLANFAYLNPGYVFPEIDSSFTGFEATALGHPLLKPDVKVCNDFELKQPSPRIAILTGSNMAGKSTFVRTVGINLCLAYAGVPVNAARLRVSLFRVFTCIKVSDSVQDGISYFYAEVKRLKALFAAAETKDDLPVFFLIDEIFRGTNNRERHLGGRAFVHALSTRTRSLGIISTHDLELAKLSDEIAGIVNFHFRDELHNGRMVFDYRLQAGPCTTTNALEIMRIEGLPEAAF